MFSDPRNGKEAIANMMERLAEINCVLEEVNSVKNSFLSGNATREEIFLALNNAGTNLLICKESYLRLVEIMAFFFGEDVPNTLQCQLPSVEAKNSKTKPTRKKLGLLIGGNRRTPILTRYKRPDDKDWTVWKGKSMKN